MNILIPHTWLLEHLETTASPEEIQKYLSLAGPSVERIYDREGEPVYDIEITTNRVDAMSVRGVAREAAVILQQFGISARLKQLHLPKATELHPVTSALQLPKLINLESVNKRTIFVALSGVKRSATPEWMAKRLRQIDMNVHDAVIDITNYVTHDLGHPCHAFDYDKLMSTGGEIHVEEAKKGERFITLDGTEFITVGGEVVFKNGNGDIIDLPSIKGTANTSIDESTQNVLLLLESIRADKVRFASMTHAIRTTAAQLMEKNVDPYLAELVLVKGVKLYSELCDAQIASNVFDEFTNKPEPTPITINLKRIDEYLGLELSIEQIRSILEQLECTVEIHTGSTRNEILTVTPPTFRPDIEIPADIIEEIARVYGYHNLPSTIPDGTIPTTKQEGVNFTIESKIKNFLVHTGWQEVYTYSMVGEELAVQSGYSLSDHLTLQNPLTDDRVHLRRSLLPSLEEVIAQNPQRTDLAVFEVANTYTPQSKHMLPDETLHLSLVSKQEYRLVRGSLESLLDALFVQNYTITPLTKASKQFSQEAVITAVTKEGNKQALGSIGILKSGHVAVDILIHMLLTVARSHPAYEPLPKTMILREDMTFQLPESVAVGDVLTDIREANKLINLVTLKEIYQRNHTFSIEYYNAEQNVTSEQVAPIREDLRSTIEKNYRAKLIGKV